MVRDVSSPSSTKARGLSARGPIAWGRTALTICQTSPLISTSPPARKARSARHPISAGSASRDPPGNSAAVRASIGRNARSTPNASRWEVAILRSAKRQALRGLTDSFRIAASRGRSASP